MLVSIVVTLFVAIQDPIIQRFAVRFAGGYLSEKTGADVKVGRIVVTPDLRVFIRDVSVKDLNDNALAEIGRFRTKIHVGDILDGKVHLGNVELGDADINLIKYGGSDVFNFQFLADFFSSGKEKEKKNDKEPMPIIIDKISLQNVDFQMWDQNKADSTKTAQNCIDYSHLDLDDISFEAKHFALVGDSVYVVVEKLAAKEQSGLDLKHFQSDVIVCKKGILLKDMQMETNSSLFHLDLNMNYSGFEAFKNFVDSVSFDANFYPTDVMLSDIGYFASVMNKMPNRLQFEGRFSGPIRHFRVDDMKVGFGKETSIRGSLSMHPLDFMDGEHNLNIRNMHFTYDDLASFHIPGSTGTVPLPEQLNTLKSGDIKLNFKGSYNDFVSNINLVSDIGNVEANVSRSRHADGSNLFFGNIHSQGIDAGMIANASNLVGKLDLDADFSARFPKDGIPDFSLDGHINNADLLGNHIDIVELNGDLKENRFDGKLRVVDNEIDLDFNGLIDFSNPKKPVSDFEADIRHADLRSLNIMKEDSVAVVSTKIYANMTGFDIDNLEGTLHLDSTVYRDSRGQYVMKTFDARIVNDNLVERRINLTNDFFDFEMGGKVNFASLMMALNAYGDTFVHFPIYEQRVKEYEEYKLKHDVEQDFFVHLNLKDTETLSRLFMPSLHVAKNTTLNGTFTSRRNALNLTVRCPKVNFGDVHVNNIELKNFTTPRAAYGTLSIGEVKWTSDTLAYGLDNLSFAARMANDSIATTIKWDDLAPDDHNKALIETTFSPHDDGGTFKIHHANIVINDSAWTIAPANYIDFGQDGIVISNIRFSHHEQSLRIDGKVPHGEADTLSLHLNRFDIAMLDPLLQPRGLDIDGFVSGSARVGNLKGNPLVLADLTINRLGLDGQTFGDAAIHSNWNNDGQSIDVDAGILTGGKRSLSLVGKYYTSRKKDNLDFNIEMDSLHLAVASPFVAGQVSRLQGFGTGNMTVSGSLEQPKMEGRLSIKGGGCKIAYLNTFYTFSPTILLNSSAIEFKDMVLADTLGNKAAVDGKILHNNLKDLYLDIRLRPREFLAMATTLKNNDTFYGTVVTDGIVTVKGPLTDIGLDIKAMTRKGTKLTLPLNRVSTVSDKDFIVFVNPAGTEEESEETVVETPRKRNFALGLDVNVSDDAGIKIILPGDIGTIDAAGHGNIKLGSSSTESLSLFGDYIIKEGRFILNFKDILTKNFSLRQGGTISWTGSPTDGRINATGVYSVKTSLASLGVQVDSTSYGGSTSVNAECLIHLKDALLNPTITFGLNLPNASEDVKQTVYALIDTTNQAVMSTQALSLLVLGSFSNANDMGDPLGALSSNLFGGGMNLELSKDLDLGFRYNPGAGYNSVEELQMALKMELFENRLIIETNLGMVTDNNSNAASNASNFVGEVDAKLKLTKDGRLMAHFYNHSNYNNNYSSLAFDKLAPYTQGLGLTYSRTFDSFRTLFKPKKTVLQGGPLINKNPKNVPFKP